MKYPYIVKVNGVYYEAGQEVPASKPVKEVKQEVRPTYTKTDINRMNKETLIEKATEIGVEDAEELSGNVLKDKLIEYYNL
jgi:hypothetical protein